MSGLFGKSLSLRLEFVAAADVSIQEKRDMNDHSQDHAPWKATKTHET